MLSLYRDALENSRDSICYLDHYKKNLDYIGLD